ncbi:VanW family protein [Psychrobacillus sp. FSL H8-0484]|uniref:VanW family protein n=1 Tax=Psychrobacillus sp. FSL H8-0484 TaxID=2921390 RepID=UPI0030F9CC95
MKVIWKTSILLILTFFLFYLWSSNNFTSLQQFAKAESGVPSSTIGGQEVELLRKDEIISLLNTKILEWKEKPILLTGNNSDLTLLPEWFTFDVEATVDQYLMELDKHWYTFWESTPSIHIPMQFSMNPEVNNLIEQKTQLNKEETLANIVSQVGLLSPNPIETVAIDSSVFELERLAFDIEEIPVNTNDLENIVSTLNEQVIGNGDIFSLLERLNDLELDVNDESSDFVASVLYSVILQTNFEILERHSQGKIPDYLEPGIEAEIRKNTNVDLKFVNNNDAPATLKVQIKGPSLLVEIYTLPLETTATYRVTDRKQIKPRTIYRYSAELKAGEEKLVHEGKEGLRVSTYRTIADKTGPYQNEVLISQDFYPPVNRVILKSSLVPETTTVTDPDLEIDLNGDGLPDVESPTTTRTTPIEVDGTNVENPPEVDESTGLSKGSYYDKAGNIIVPESK